jgi:hypothetical protein
MNQDIKSAVPQGLKPPFWAALSGTAEAVAFQKLIYEMASSWSRLQQEANFVILTVWRQKCIASGIPFS